APLSLILFLYFFFSSRRRHTRFSRDWSSDVCSSDLPQEWASCHHRAVPLPGSPETETWRRAHTVDPPPHPHSRRGPRLTQPVTRSEERRVGKERRPRKPLED